MNDRLPRKLTAILYADVAGYSRLTGEDEDGTHRMLRAYLGLIASRIREHDGRVVHYAGDAVLADFGTVVDALGCAADFQRELAERNAAIPQARRVEFRVGVNLGDVIVDGDEIYGEGVNVAARLESLADPGGICVSDAVRAALGRKLGLHYEDMGAQNVKNIADAIRCFRVHLDASAIERGAVASAPAQKATEADRPAVVVRPFTFIGDAGEHGYLADAITGSIGSALSHFREFRIVEGTPTGDASFALNGTLQIAGTRVRINPQLSGVRDARKLWAENFDRELADVFELQDEISAIVAAYLGEAIWQQTARTLAEKSKDDFSPFDWCSYATEHIHQLTKNGFAESRKACRKALSMDPEFLPPKLLLAFTLTLELGWCLAENDREARDEALALTEELLLKDAMNATVHRMTARLYSILGRATEALAHSERALALNPYDGDVLVMHGMTLTRAGRADEATPWIEKALRYNPQPPGYYRQTLMASQLLAGDRESALETLRQIEGALSPSSRLVGIAVLQATGYEEEATSRVATLAAEDSEICLQSARALLSRAYTPEDTGIVLDALRDAGLPKRPASRDP